MAEEEERHKGSLTQKKQKNSQLLEVKATHKASQMPSLFQSRRYKKICNATISLHL
jgi:hypothetical protein